MPAESPSNELTSEYESYKWSDPEGPPDGRYVAHFEEALDGPTLDAPRAAALSVYDVSGEEDRKVGTAAVVTEDVPELVDGQFERGAFVAEIVDGKFVDLTYSEDLTEERSVDMSWFREQVGDR